MPNLQVVLHRSKTDVTQHENKNYEQNIAVATIGLMLTASLSGCFSNDNGSSADEPGSIYEPGPYEVLKYENIILRMDLHTRNQVQNHLLSL